MAKEICISSTPHETRLAILEDDQLAEIYYERENEYTLAGSIYNGRVTRVLPGMQSAFVDIGLERDAFLYVTDFLELEDEEETDELEKAASSPSQQVREVRSGGERNGQRSERPSREQRPAAAEVEASEAHFAAPQAHPGPDQKQDEQETDEHGAKRWRGRRRRRGGRGGSGSQAPERETEGRGEAGPEEAVAESTAREARNSAPAAPRSDRTPAALVLPGESLRKYGGSAAEETSKSAAQAAAPSRPSPTSKPSTLIESPIAWDGSGLLPGESLSRHRTPQPEHTAEVDAEPQGTFADAVEKHAGFEVEEHASAHTSLAVPIDEELVEESLVQEGLLDEEHPVGHTVPEATIAASGVVVSEPSTLREKESAAVAAPEEIHAEAEAEPIEHHDDEPEADAHASHHVDPLPPTTFRLFGLGGKKKRSRMKSRLSRPNSIRVLRVT